MRCLPSLALVVLLGAGAGVPTVSPPSVVPNLFEESCDLTPDGAKHLDAEETAIPATVTGIDREQGVVNLETEVARAQVTVPPDVLQELHVGDRVELCMADEDPSQNLLQDSIIT
jgi:hypothetical protein